MTSECAEACRVALRLAIANSADEEFSERYKAAYDEIERLQADVEKLTKALRTLKKEAIDREKHCIGEFRNVQPSFILEVCDRALGE